MTKLTEDDVRAIRTNIMRGSTIRQLSEEFGISIRYVRSILSGKAWPNVELNPAPPGPRDQR